MEFDFSKIQITDLSDVQVFYNDLIIREINNLSDLELWIKNRSDLNAFVDEDLAWRYIKMTCNTENKAFSADYDKFISEIQPEISKQDNILNKKLVESPYFEQLSSDYLILKRSIKNEIELYREKNLKLHAEIESLSSKFGTISGAMTVNYKGEEMTLQAASNYLKETDRALRKEFYFMIQERRFEDVSELDNLLSDLVAKRHQVAVNAGFENFRDYKHIANERFDYSVADVLEFDEAIRKKVVPIMDEITLERKQNLNYTHLKPWDLLVNEHNKEPLKVFNSIDEFVDKTITCFSKVRPQYGEYLKIMKEQKYLDLASRKGKAPGGYNYPLLVSNIPFIFMNATSNLRDLETLVHEGGHAIHSFKAKDLKLSEYKNTPSEIAELASMSMELISMEHWDVFFENPEDLQEAKIHQLEGVLSVLPWVATIDKFQHWLYTNPKHSIEQRRQAWAKIFNDYSSKHVDYSDVEKYYFSTWQKQMHIFEVPFYYIEYAIAQLGAIAIWKNYKENPEQTLDNYEKALALGYSKTLPELYKTAGIEFNFSQEYIGELMIFVTKELKKIKS